MITVFAPEVTIVGDINFREKFCSEHNSLQIKPKEEQNCLQLLFHYRITAVKTFKALLILWKSLDATKELSSIQPVKSGLLTDCITIFGFGSVLHALNFLGLVGVRHILVLEANMKQSSCQIDDKK